VRRWFAGLLVILPMLLLSGCGTVGYYWQSVSGHMQMLNAARPITEVLKNPQTPAALKARLALSQRMRRFAATKLGLPDNASYTSYADLHRSAVVWNVVAAPELSLTLKTWCFPVAGCVGYRGYFKEADARQLAQQLKAEGLDVSVYGVPAYSTLGKLDWLGDFGADPLLNTFIGYPEGELARLMFHELAHQVLYAAGDTMFNESFATAVERLGSQRWLTTEASQRARDDYAALDTHRQQFRALVTATRAELAAIYTPNAVTAEEIQAQRVSKKIAIEKFRSSYETLKESWGMPPQRTAGYDALVAKANNASFGAQAAYDELVPGFEALFEREGQDWQRFYDAVRQLADLPKDERHQALKAKN
jgi:predicted aminopeptidase